MSYEAADEKFFLGVNEDSVKMVKRRLMKRATHPETGPKNANAMIDMLKHFSLKLNPRLDNETITDALAEQLQYDTAEESGGE